jgi:hypothetical protein
MPRSLKSQVSLIDTPCCVHDTLCETLFFVWGSSRATDNYSGQSYEHRRVLGRG